jgi:U2 small nuclear ribonucleoprotein A'
MPKPDTNMAEASEEADKMETDGQNQESGADEQKQVDGNTLIEEV